MTVVRDVCEVEYVNVLWCECLSLVGGSIFVGLT